MATLTYLTGFEHAQNVLGIAGGGLQIAVGSPTVSTSAPITGAADMVCDLGDVLEMDAFAGVNVASIKWKPTSFGSGKATLLFGLSSGGSSGLAIYYDSADGKLHAVEGGAIGPPWVTVGSPVDGPSVSLNTVYQIDCRMITNGATWTLEWQVDGVAQPTLTKTGKSNTPLAFGPSAWSTGTTATGTWVFRFDDLCLSATSGDYPIGPRTVIGFTVDQAAAAEHQGTLSGWQYADTDGGAATAITATSETASRSRIDDLNATDNVQVNSAAPTGSLRWPLADPPGDPGTAPDAVIALIAVKESATGANNATLRTYLSGSTDNIFSGDPGWGTTWNVLRRIMAARPGGGAWTNQNVKDLRVEFLSTDGAPAVRLGGVFYEAAYPPGVATLTKRWDGTSWQTATVKRWDGTAWQPATVKRQTAGAAWQ